MAKLQREIVQRREQFLRHWEAFSPCNCLSLKVLYLTAFSTHRVWGVLGEEGPARRQRVLAEKPIRESCSFGFIMTHPGSGNDCSSETSAIKQCLYKRYWSR